MQAFQNLPEGLKSGPYLSPLIIILRISHESAARQRLPPVGVPLKTFDHLTVVGLREWVALPDLGVAFGQKSTPAPAPPACMPPTSRPSSATVSSGCASRRTGTVVQLRHRRCEAPLVTMKTIKSSNGHAQVRYVISTTLALGDRVWRVQFTLACRKSMRYRLLLLVPKPRIDGQLVVNPGIKYVQDKPVFPVSASSTGVA
jgi:hypothetical protein